MDGGPGADPEHAGGITCCPLCLETRLDITETEANCGCLITISIFKMVSALSYFSSSTNSHIISDILWLLLVILYKKDL